MVRRPVVALVGRPNVGKSTLFNRLAGERLAVVAEAAGTTRDRQVTEVEWGGIVFDLIDTGGIDPTPIGSGEPLSVDSSDYIEQIRAQAEFAANSADLVLFVVDAADGVTSADQEVAQILRRQGTSKGGSPILLVANKAENRAKQESAVEFFELGMGEPFTVSALHGTGSGDLLDAILEQIEAITSPSSEAEDEYHGAKIAIVGRPNVGKSSLYNRILGEERVLVSDLAGTTRDSIDTRLTYHGVPITLIDTAGMRRRGKVEPGVEKYSVIRALEAVDRADLVLLIIDAVDGVTAQDAHIGGIAIEKFKSVVLLINKWDLVDKDTYTLPEQTIKARSQLKFLDYVPVLFISALTGQRVARVLPTALEVQQERYFRISTGRLNRVIQNALTNHAPPSKSGRRLNIMYTTQVGVDPPSFLFHVNDPKLAHFSYRRYLENKIREEHPFVGTPLHLRFKPRKRE